MFAVVLHFCVDRANPRLLLRVLPPSNCTTRSAAAAHGVDIKSLIPNRQAANPEFGILYGLSSIWLGIASFTFHASHAEPWRKADAGMTSGVVISVVVFGLWDRLRPPGMSALVLVLVGAVLQFSLTHGYLPYGSSDVLLPSLVATAMAVEFVPRYGGAVVWDQYKHWAAVLYAVLCGLLLRLADVKRENKPAFNQLIKILVVITVFPFGWFLGFLHPHILFGVLGLALVLKDASRGHIWWHFGSSYSLFGWWYMMRTRPGDPLQDQHETDTLWAAVLLFAFLKNAARRIFMALPFPSAAHRDRTFFTVEHILWSIWGYYVIVLLPEQERPGSSWLYNGEQIWKLPTFPSESFRLFYMAKTAGALEDLVYRWVAMFNHKRNAALAVAANPAPAVDKASEGIPVSSEEDTARLLFRKSAPGTATQLKVHAQEAAEADLKMDIHHITTAALCLSSLYFGLTHIGSNVMFVHDLTDVPLDFVRLFGVVSWLNAQALAMFATLGMWAYWRLYYLPAYLLWSAVYDSKIEVFGHECRFRPGRFIYFDFDCPAADGSTEWGNTSYIFLIAILVALHYIWYAMMVRKTYVELWGKRRCKPVR